MEMKSTDRILPGKYTAKVADHEMQMKEGGNAPSVGVRFQLIEEGRSEEMKNSRTITWYGSFSGGARPITVENLVRLGFTGKDGTELARFQGEGKDLKPIALDTESVFELVIEDDTYNGKTRPRVKFINVPGHSSFQRMDQVEAKTVIGGLNLAGDFAEARSGAGKPKAKAAPATKPAAAPSDRGFTEEQIPF